MSRLFLRDGKEEEEEEEEEPVIVSIEHDSFLSPSPRDGVIPLT